MNNQKQAAIEALEYAIHAILNTGKHDIINGYGDLVRRLEIHTHEMVKGHITHIDDEEERLIAEGHAKDAATSMALSLAAMAGIAQSDAITFDIGVSAERERSGGVVADDDVAVNDNYLGLLFDHTYQCSRDDCDNGVDEDGEYCSFCVENMSYA
jgi:hypothetical protein